MELVFGFAFINGVWTIQALLLTIVGVSFNGIQM